MRIFAVKEASGSFMGVIQFRVERPDLLSAASATSLVDFVMYDGRIIPARTALTENLLRCERVSAESGQMRILWPRFDGSCQIVHTTSLREQSEPYHLEVELARGQLSRLRNQFYSWSGAGLQSSQPLDHLIHEAHRSFRAAVLRSEAPELSAGAALLSIDLSSRATDLLCQHYVEQRISYRRNRSAHLPVFLGCHLNSIPGDPVSFCNAFNAVQIDTQWNTLEQDDGDYQWDRMDQLVAWALEQRLFIMGGPLLDLSQDTLPSWLRSWAGDLVNLQSFTADFVETVVGRYVGRIRHWEVVTGANRGGVAELDEEQRLNLVARTIEAARQVDEHTQISLRVVQPWGEYLSQTKNRLSPMQFIDTLRRCGIRLGEINLDIRVGNLPSPTLWRDCLSLSQMLDQWSLLQLPLNVMLTLPSLSDGRGMDTEVSQSVWLENAVQMCLAKERVVGVYCTNWNQELDTKLPTALVNPNGQPREPLLRLHHLAREYWS
jgi:hypothetical protein